MLIAVMVKPALANYDTALDAYLAEDYTIAFWDSKSSPKKDTPNLKTNPEKYSSEAQAFP